MKPPMLVAALLFAASAATAQDPVKLSPTMYKVLLDNDEVRVLDFRAKPGEKEPMHSHPRAIVYILSAGKAKATTRDGKTEIIEGTPGTAVWGGAVTHSFEATGPGDVHVIIVEFKRNPPAGRGAPDAAAVLESLHLFKR